MITEDDRKDMRVRVALLEASHVDLTAKVGTLIEGFNSLNVNLSTLITSINTSIRLLTLGSAIVATLAGGFWAYHTYMTAKIEQIESTYQINRK